MREKIAQINDEEIGDRKLKPLVRAFQRHEGLVADGIVGPETIIHINSSTESSAPSLKVN